MTFNKISHRRARHLYSKGEVIALTTSKLHPEITCIIIQQSQSGEFETAIERFFNYRLDKNNGRYIKYYQIK